MKSGYPTMRPSIGLDDGAVVTMAANHLDVSEFEIFRASYQSWYDDEGSDALIERHFGDYLKHGDLPFWVRHFSRERLSQEPCEESLRDGLAQTLDLVLSLFGSVGTERGARIDASSLAA
jgi:hypothetical protein